MDKQSAIILKSLIKNNMFFSSTFMVLNRRDFDDTIDKFIFDSIEFLYKKYNKITNYNEMELHFSTSSLSDDKKDKILERLNEIKNTEIEDISDDLLIDSVEKYIKESRFYRDVIIPGAEMEDGNKEITTESLQRVGEEINKISFKKSEGLNYKKDAQQNFIQYGEEEKIDIKSSLNIVNLANGGGFKRGTLFIYASVSNMGKTTFLVNEALSAMIQKKKVAFFSFEEKEISIRERFDGSFLNMKTSDLKLYHSSLFNKFKNLSSNIGDLMIKSYGPNTASILNVKAQLDKWKLELNFDPDIILLDSLTIISSTIKASSSYEKGKLVSEDAKSLAVQLDKPVISAVQFGRQSYGSKNVGMEDVSESLAIMQVGDSSISVVPDEKRPDIRLLSIIKSRKVNKSKTNSSIVNIDTDKQKVWDLSEGERKNIKKETRQIAENIKNKVEQAEELTKNNDDYNAIDAILNGQ